MSASKVLPPSAIRGPIFLLLVCLLMSGGCGKAQKSTDEMLADLEHGKERDRIIAVRLLPERRQDAARIIPALIAALDDRSHDVRIGAAGGLGSFGAEASGATAKLQALAKDRNRQARAAAAAALAKIGEKS
jgi:HEAT repeat protein